MNDEMESKKNANANTMKISLEESALQRIFDLKKDYSVELESHHTKLKEGLLWNLFIKGIDPPPWLRLILSPSSKYGSGYRDSFNSSIRDDRFSGFGRFGRKRPRFYSSAPDCFLEETELEGFENGYTIGTGSKQVLDDAQNEGIGGKQSLVDAQVGRNAGKQHSPDAQVDKNGIKEHLADAQVDQIGINENLADAQVDQNGINENLADAQVDQNGIKEHLVDAQIGRNLENHDLPALAQMDMDICEMNKGAEDVVNGSGKGKKRSRAQARGLAKERNKTGNVVKSPFVGRMTRSRAKQCQIPVSGNELGKRKAIASEQTSNKRVRHVIGVEEPNNVTLRSSKKAGPRISNSFCFATSTLEPQGIIPSAMTQSHFENHKTEGNSSAVRTLMQGANNSVPSVTAMLEAENNAIIDKVDFEKEMLKKSGVKSRDLEQVYEQVEESVPLPVRRSIVFHDLDITQQPEISEATDTAQHQDISNAPLETIKEKKPLEFRSELTSRVIEECVETVHHSEALEAVVNPKQDGISEIIDRQVDSALASSFHDLQKHDINIILDPTKRFRSRSLCLDCCKNIPWKVNNSDSKLFACRKQADDVVVGGGDCTNQIHFRRSQRLSKKSEIITSQGEGDQNHFSSEEGSPAASIYCLLSSEKKSGKQSGRTGFETNPFKTFDVPASAAKGWKPQHTSWPGDRKQKVLAEEPRLLQAHDVVVGGGDYTNQIHFCRSQRLSKKSEILTAQGERDQNHFSSEEGSSAASICCSLSFEKKSGKQSGRTGFETNRFKIFDVPASAAKGLKPQHISWPGDRKQNALAQESRLLQAHDVVVGGGDYTNQIQFSRSQILSKKSEIHTAQGETDQNNFFSEEGSSAASICCSLPFEKKSSKQSGRTGFETNPFKILDAPASAAKELKPQHTSWPGDRKQNALAQEPRLLQSKSCSGVFEYSNPALDSNANDAGLISQFELAVTPYTSNSKIDKENEGQRNVGMMKKISSEVEIDIVPQKSEVIEFVTEKMDEPTEFVSGEKGESSAHLLKTGDILRKVQNCNSTLRIFCQNEVSKGQMDTIFDAPANASRFNDLLDMNIDFMNFITSENRKLFSDNVVRTKEEGSKPQHRSWPGDHKQNALAQEPRLLQSKSCSGVFKYRNHKLDSNVNDDGLVSQFEWVVTPHTSNSKFGKENEGQSNVDMMKNIPSEVEDDIVPQKSEVIEFVAEEMDEPSEHLLKSVNMRGRLPAFDFCKDGSYGERKDSGHVSHGVLTSQIGMSISEVDPKKKIDCLEADCQVEVTIANSELAEGVRGIPGMQHLIQSSYMLSPTKPTVDASGNLKELEGLHHGFSSNDRQFSPVKMNAKAEKGLGYEAIRDGRASFVNGTKAFTSLTPAPIHVSKCRLRTASDVHWRVLAMEPPDYSENSSEFLEKIYGPNGSSADKIWANSGSKDVAYGSKIKYSGSLTSTSRMLFDRTATNSVATSSNLFMIQDEMNRERAGCFPIEEESGFEEESMNLHATVNESAKSPLMKKSVLGAKSVLLDCTSAKQNSPLMTPAGERLFQRSSTYSTDIGSNLFSKEVSKSQKYLRSFNLEEQVVYGKENKVPCKQGSELQKKYGSSVKKKVMKNHNLPNDGSFASQISPRSHQKPSNILSNVKSFIPLVQQKKAAASVMTGKRDIKVKALEVAEAAKRQEEKKEQERKMRKELARRGGHETNLHDKSKEEGGETSRGTSECSNISISSGLPRKRLVGCASQKSHVENSSQPDTAACGVELKVKRVLEAKTKLEQERLRKLEEEQKRKEEERKKKEADIAAKKRKREEIERKEREEKRKRYEVAQRQQKELEEQLRTEKEVKEQRRRALDDYERKRRAMEEETKKQRRLDKEKEAAERRRQLEEDAKANKFTYKDAKHVDETNLQAQKAYAGKVSSMSNNCGNTGQLDIEGQSRHVEINAESYEISPYKGSDEDDDDSAPKKFIPLWARKENVIPHIISQQHIDPDEIFTGAKTCSLYEVFGTDGSLRRRDFSRRSHSGEWLNDKFTWKEEYQYKLQMGYLN